MPVPQQDAHGTHRVRCQKGTGKMPIPQMPIKATGKMPIPQMSIPPDAHSGHGQDAHSTDAHSTEIIVIFWCHYGSSSYLGGRKAALGMINGHIQRGY
ncbi:hypothetical protein [Moorena sp. SIO3I6]|uniref:hypothetical protein n=1 Tax=Moorena sp. SIO3I6 TaxID=2607831 RepID=UPI0025D782E3|nr:hypothetical protein [Moorena sp. SIO3I6]